MRLLLPPRVRRLLSKQKESACDFSPRLTVAKGLFLSLLGILYIVILNSATRQDSSLSISPQHSRALKRRTRPTNNHATQFRVCGNFPQYCERTWAFLSSRRYKTGYIER